MSNLQAATEGSGPHTDHEESQSLDDIWKAAVTEIEKDNGLSFKDLQKDQCDDFNNTKNGLWKASELFQKSRHPDERKAKVIEAVAGCLDWIDSGVSYLRNHMLGTVSYLILAKG